MDQRIYIRDAVNRIVAHRAGYRGLGDDGAFGRQGSISKYVGEEHFIGTLNVVEKLLMTGVRITKFCNQTASLSMLFLRRLKGVDVNGRLFGTYSFQIPSNLGCTVDQPLASLLQLHDIGGVFQY
ncbi:hypothetical protein SDC9_185063 [bioreactor metagenome]|uniref:Uncharacterized protein n=1 Tax=bioreactor metagenome TaxID=1076179 RepID=A0A645HQ95_9ZZZZ